MPLYDYQCASCEHRMEVLQKISAAPLTDCPACQAPAMKKLLSVPGFRLVRNRLQDRCEKESGRRRQGRLS